jgi:hypothetical protein
MRWLAPTLLFFSLLLSPPVPAHDMDHPEFDSWYAELRMPDNPTVSCCGKADAYWCDDVHTKGGKNFCTITDDRVIPGRTPFPVGTEIEIPDYKLKWDRGNPTGHAVVFLSSGGLVYCFVQSGGV